MQIFLYVDEDIFEMEDVEIEGINLLIQTTEVITMYSACIILVKHISVCVHVVILYLISPSVGYGTALYIVIWHWH